MRALASRPGPAYRGVSHSEEEPRLARLRFALLALAFAAAPALAEERQVPTSAAELHLSFAPVVAKARPSVVNVYASRVETMPRNPMFDDPFFRHFFGAQPEGRKSRVAQSLGSGVIVDSAGLVVTNHHVIEGMTEVKVALSDHREYPAEIVLRDPRTDLAVLKIVGAEKLPALELGDSDAIEVGDFVIAIGNPFGVGQSVTQGIVSALARTQVGVSDYGFFIQTDAAINPGNSGGALVDTWGRLVGVNSAIYSRSGGSMGIGFAIPVNMVKSVIATAKSGGTVVKRPFLGAKLQNVTRDIAESLGLDRPVGAMVASVERGAAAAQAGLKRGDVITAVDGQSVDDAAGVDFRIGVKPLGGVASLSVLRAGKSLVLPLKLEPAPETVPRDAVRLSTRSPFQGAQVMNLSPAVLDALSLDADALGASEGVVVADVEPNSPAAEFGFQKGDVVLSVNGVEIHATRDLVAATARAARAWDLVISRAGQTIRTRIGF
ncbi:MAG: DegQ family serine endoprotease [Pseudomonadota bacterium]|nr:DegQ family serine endoprotease [Pseudomonadota bacterium]